jgi:hypothetical protein
VTIQLKALKLATTAGPAAELALPGTVAAESTETQAVGVEQVSWPQARLPEPAPRQQAETSVEPASPLQAAATSPFSPVQAMAEPDSV